MSVLAGMSNTTIVPGLNDSSYAFFTQLFICEYGGLQNTLSPPPTMLLDRLVLLCNT